MQQLYPSALSNPHIDREAVFVAIARFLCEIESERAPVEVSASTPLIGSGLLDSLSMLKLTMSLGDHFGITFDDTDFTLENFETADQLATLVLAKRGLR